VRPVAHPPNDLDDVLQGDAVRDLQAEAALVSNNVGLSKACGVEVLEMQLLAASQKVDNLVWPAVASESVGQRFQELCGLCWP
jgi:hypothetical protein